MNTISVTRRSPSPIDPENEDGSIKRQATRVFKKSSSNGKITVYLGKRDFVDHITHVDPIDGVVLIDPEYVRDRKVFGNVLAAFRYGREDLDVLGLTFRKDLYIAHAQIYPPESNGRPLTRLQERLIKKLGPNAYPFYFEVPPHCPASVSLQPAPGDTGKPCGVDYELKAFVAENIDDKPHKRNSVRLAIRKIMYAPSKIGEQPSIEVSKEFMLKPNKIHLEASLDKELYHHGETISVNVHVANNSNRTVKKIKIFVRQFADICLFSTAQYKCIVAETESEDNPVTPGFTLSKVYTLIPLLQGNTNKRGLALDGQLKHEDTNLASSTMDGLHVAPGFTLSKVFELTPLLANNKDKWGLALDGQLKHEDTNLASSTLANGVQSTPWISQPFHPADGYIEMCLITGFIPPEAFVYLDKNGYIFDSDGVPIVYHVYRLVTDMKIEYPPNLSARVQNSRCTYSVARIADPSQRESLGIIVQYKVKVKLFISGPILGGDLVAELPFILMHPKPLEETDPILLDRSPRRNRQITGSQDNPSSEIPTTNLIQLDGDEAPDDDIIFEDFARLRLKGAETEA